MSIRWILWSLSPVVLALAFAADSLTTQTSTVTSTAITTFFTTMTTTLVAVTTLTTTSTTIVAVPVSIVGVVNVEKVITQFDITSLVAVVVGTIVASLLGAGVGAFIQSRREGALVVRGNTIYCRRHGTPVTITPVGVYCPVHGRIIVS